MMVCHNHLCGTKLKPKKVKDFDVAGAIHDCLNVLVTQEQLNKQEEILKKPNTKQFLNQFHMQMSFHEIKLQKYMLKMLRKQLSHIYTCSPANTKKPGRF